MARWGVMILLVALLGVSITTTINWLTNPSGGQAIDFVGEVWMHESADWDEKHNRILFSTSDGSISELRVDKSDGVLAEKKVVQDADYAGNATLGIRLDSSRGRVLVCIADMSGRGTYSALASYDTRSWDRQFLIQLPNSGKFTMADDVAIDGDGNGYVTDAVNDCLWKVSPDGKEVSVLTASPVFKSAPGLLPFDLVGLNGIVLHPHDYLLVGHSWSGALYKVSLDGTSVKRVNLTRAVYMNDGILLLTPQKLVVTGTISMGAWMLETSDDWNSAVVTQRFIGPVHRLPSAAFLMKGKTFVNFMLGYGIGLKSFTLREAQF